MKKRLETYKGGAAFLLATIAPAVLVTIIMYVIAFIMSMSSGIDVNSALASDTVTFIGLAATQIFMLLIVLLFTKGGKDIKEVCAFTKPTKKLDYLFAVILTIGMFLGLTILSSLFMAFLGLFGYTPTPTPFPDMTKTSNFLTGIFVVGIMPAICEELVFRGIILNATSNKGKWFGIIFSGLLFMLMHASPLQTIYQLAFGVIFAIVAIKSGSILLGMIMHFINNFLAIVLEYVGLGEIEFPWYVVLLGLILVAGALTYFMLKKEPKEEIDKENNNNDIFSTDEQLNEILKAENKRNNNMDKFLSIIFYGAGIVICLVNWILLFVQGLQ